MLSIWSGPARILADGSVTSFGGHPLYFELEVEERKVALGFRFLSDSEEPGATVRTATLADGYRIDLVNFDDAEGRGSAQPVLLDEIGDDLVFVHFRCFRFGKSADHTLSYTFYRVAKASVGWTPVVPPESEG
jgi:hypothetical protein